MPFSHFLLAYDHQKRKLLEQVELRDTDAAVHTYREMEKKYEDQKSVEVVLVGSDSIETVKVTHANYFEGGFPKSPYFAGILD